MERAIVGRSQSQEPPGSGFDRKFRAARLEEDIRRLEKEIATKRRELAYLSAAYSLPDDVWYHILEIAYQHHFPECHTEQSVAKGFPVPIAHVSQRFRALVSNIPAVWSCIHIIPRFGRASNFSSLLDAQLTYSRNRPLSILLSCQPNNVSPFGSYWTDWERFCHTEEVKHYYDCWELLLEHGNRWRRLAFYSRLHGFAEELLTRRAFKRGSLFPCLEQLDVYVHHDVAVTDDSVEHLTLPLEQVEAPSLQCLRAHNLFVVAPRPSTHQLRELVIQNMTIKMIHPHIIDVLNANATTLETLIVVDVRWQSHEYVGNHDFTSSRLQTLDRLRYLFLGAIDIRVTFASLLHTVLEASPRLLRLDIGNPQGSIEQVLAFLEDQSYPSVQAVGLDFSEPAVTGEGDPPLYPFLECFPGMRSLLVADCNHIPYLRTLLDHSLHATRPAEPPPWLSFQELILTGNRSRACSDTSVLGKFVDHRAQIGCPLLTLRLDMRAFAEDILHVPRQRLTVIDLRTETVQLQDHFAMGRWQTGRYGDEPEIPLWSSRIDAGL